MAPDVNTLSNIPSELSAAQPATSQPAMGPPSIPASAQQNVRSPVITNATNMDLPLRHPRPLTAAELYQQCEREQEAVVNRLTRELTALRAQSASVASNASHSSTSTSASLLPIDISDPNPAHQLIGATHPTPSRRHRSSSSLSTRSIPTPSTTASGPAASHNSNVQANAGMSQASLARAAATAGQSLGRRPSTTASDTSTPARRSMELSRQSLHVGQASYRPALSRDASFASQGGSSIVAQAGTPAPHRVPSPVTSPNINVQASMQHYAETAAYRSEMEDVKAENELLRQRVRTLESALSSRRRDSSRSDVAEHAGSRYTREGLSPTTSSGVAAWVGAGIGGVAGPRERSESQSTTASSRRGIPVDEEVRVGESAASLASRIA